jgi:hypothetical protein
VVLEADLRATGDAALKEHGARTFEIPIGDALYGRLMKDVPFSPPRGFSLPLPALTTARGYRQREVP